MASSGKYPYDEADPQSIFDYGMQLINHSLRDIVGDDNVNKEKRKAGNKGGLGQLVEKLHFLYDCNSNSEPDFKEAGLELKVTGLKQLQNRTYMPKERLVCNIINYYEEHKLTFETSTFMQKCAFMFVLFYIYEKEVDYADMIFKNGILWNLPEKDLLIIKQDWETIVNKIKQGKAHEISEGDTTYLGACTKGADSIKSNVRQPFSKELARQRAFSLKASYLKTILDAAELKQSSIIHKTTKSIKKVIESGEVSLVTTEELKKTTFDEVVVNKFKPYIGCNYTDISKKLSLKESESKQKYFILSQAILGIFGRKRIEEFDKAGIELKTIRMESNGKIKEHMSFPNIDYLDIINEKEWEDSFLYEEFTKRFFFVVYMDDGKSKGNYKLRGAFFWTMPPEDLEKAKLFWEDTKQKVTDNDFENFFTIRDDKMCHVRPKATNKEDKVIAPNGAKIDKKAYWLNSKYIKEIVDRENLPSVL